MGDLTSIEQGHRRRRRRHRRHQAGRRAPSAFRCDPAQAGHRRDQRRVRGHRADAQALVCDVRFAAAGAKFTTSFARRGLIAEYGISLDPAARRRLGRRDGPAAVRPGVPRRRGRALGLVKEVVPPDELLPRAIAYAEDIAANCAPSSLAVIKQQVYADTMRDVFEASDDAEKLMHESMQRPDFIEGITSFFEKRPPNFPPLNEDGMTDTRSDDRTTGLPGDRRRQPLLRADRLVHPPPAQGVQAPRRADARRTASARSR